MNRASLGSARDTRAKWQLPELEGGPEMTIVAGFDVHRRQITFDALDTETGELTRGRIDATPAAVERWVGTLRGSRSAGRAGGVHRLVVRLPRARACRCGRRISPSRSRRARCAGASGARRPIARTRAGCARCSARDGCRNPGSRRNTCGQWRSRARLRKTLVDERTQWLQRVQATLFHHGIGGAARRAAQRRRTRVPRRSWSCPLTRASESRSHWR